VQVTNLVQTITTKKKKKGKNNNQHSNLRTTLSFGAISIKSSLLDNNLTVTSEADR